MVSNNRKKQLDQQSKTDSRQWRRKVRGDPLFNLRAELAQMADKQDKLVAAASRQHTRFNGSTEEQVKEELQEAVDQEKNIVHVAMSQIARSL